MTTTESPMIHVVLADDHPIVRSGVRNEIARHADMQVVGEATNGGEALALTEALTPDLLLLDINMPGVRAVDIVRRLCKRPSPTRVVILSAYGDEEHVLALLSAGASGYVLKSEDPTVIVQAIRAAMRGILWLSPGVAQVVKQAVRTTMADERETTLTPREREVLRMIARGWDNQKIAQALSVTEATVKFHVGHVYEKLGVTSRVEAVLYAARQGWVEIDQTD